MLFAIDGVIDKNRPKSYVSPRCTRYRIDGGFKKSLYLSFVQFRITLRAGKVLSHLLRFRIQSFLQKRDFTAAFRARKDFTPDRIVDAPFSAIGMGRLIHPSDVLPKLVQQTVGFPRESTPVEWQVVIGSNKCGCRSQIIQHHPARSPDRFWKTELPSFLFDLGPQRLIRRVT